LVHLSFYYVNRACSCTISFFRFVPAFGVRTGSVGMEQGFVVLLQRLVCEQGLFVQSQLFQFVSWCTNKACSYGRVFFSSLQLLGCEQGLFVQNQLFTFCCSFSVRTGPVCKEEGFWFGAAFSIQTGRVPTQSPFLKVR
jgi:hypothetical protein